MAKELCPVCGCTMVGGGYERDGVKYCCEPCATGSGACECSAVTLSKRAKKKARLQIRNAVFAVR